MMPVTMTMGHVRRGSLRDLSFGFGLNLRHETLLDSGAAPALTALRGGCASGRHG